MFSLSLFTQQLLLIVGEERRCSHILSSLLALVCTQEAGARVFLLLNLPPRMKRLKGA